MNNLILYSDKLVEIMDDSLKLKYFYFPSMANKNIPFSTIEKIEIITPSLFNGKYRIYGTGNFRTWYPMDSSRPVRDKIFLISYKNKWIRSGFTVEDSVNVENIFRKKGLL